MRTKTKKTYNNYQFYERPALTKYLEEQSIKGYSFCGAVGEFLDVLKFSHMEDKKSKSFTILRKRLDEHIDLSLIHISEPTRRTERSRMPSSA